MGGTTGYKWWRGFRFNTRTIDMIQEAEQITGRTFRITQGSYSNASASAGTHSGGGAVDLSGNLGDAIIAALRIVGFAAWQRTPSQGPWGYHVHAIALDDPSASSSAKNQMRDYRNGRNGLANNGRDTHPRPNPIRNWEQYNEWKDREMAVGQEVWSYWNKRIEKTGDAYHILRTIRTIVSRIPNLNTVIPLRTGGAVDYSSRTTTLRGILQSNNYYSVLSFYEGRKNSEKLDRLLAMNRLSTASEIVASESAEDLEAEEDDVAATEE